MSPRRFCCSVQAARIRLRRDSPIPSTVRRRSGSPPREGGADPPDEAGGEIALDGSHRGGKDAFVRLDLELFPVPRVADPLSPEADGLPGGDPPKIPHPRRRAGVTRNLEARHDIPRLRIRVVHPDEGPLEQLGLTHRPASREPEGRRLNRTIPASPNRRRISSTARAAFSLRGSDGKRGI